MPITDRERVGRALGLLDAIRPRLRACGAAGDSEDPRVLLGEALDVMGQLVADSHKQREARTHVHELIDTRNKWAHGKPLTGPDAFRAADTVSRLLSILDIDASSAETMKSQRLPAERPPSEASEDRPHGGKRVAVIACTKQKQAGAVPALEMYTPSPLFRRCVETARADKLPIVIFSSKYGLIPTGKVIEPYEVDLREMSQGERAALESRLDEQIGRLVSAGVAEAILLAGADYRRLVEERLRSRGVNVRTHANWKAITQEVFGRRT